MVSLTLQAKDKKLLEEHLSDQYWRLNNLYYIVDEDSQRVLFRFRITQEQFYQLLWYWNLILKSRQHGATTFIDIFILDTCLFNNNIHAGIIAHDLKAAQKIFYNKIKYPYDNLPKVLKDRIPATKCDAMELRLANGSDVWVGTSMRSATLRMLHISELGKICAKYPEKAKEIKTGALPTLHEGSWLFVESTAEGSAGDFYDMAIESQSLTAQAEKEGRKLNKQQMRFHFFPWYKHPLNRTEPLGITVSDELTRYFDELEGKINEKLGPEQRAWYALKKDSPAGLKNDMKREHPSTPEEAFEQSVEGCVYGIELEEARGEGRIGFYPWNQTSPVYTFWDLGYGDATCVVYVQFIREEVRVIDFYSLTGRGAPYHAKQVNSKPYVYKDHTGGSTHYAPHDIMNHEKGTGIMLKDTYALLGIDFKTVERPRLKADGIGAVRDIFNKLMFNANNTQELVRALSFYRYEWDEEAVKFKKDPVHDWASDPADALQTMALQYRYGVTGGERLGFPYPTRVADELYSDRLDEDYDGLRTGLEKKGISGSLRSR